MGDACRFIPIRQESDRLALIEMFRDWIAVRRHEQAAAGQLGSAAAATVAVTASADLTGEQVYNQACVACHGAGVAGAPKLGDKAAWAPRIAQGIDTLHAHALQGYQGKAGYMPPKGGRTDLSDQSVINAVDYIVAASK